MMTIQCSSLSRGWKNWQLFSTTASNHNDNDLVSGYKCQVIETTKKCNRFFAARRSRPVSVVGLDCESVNDKPIALLQLAFPDKECALVRLNKIHHIPNSLALFLKDQRLV